MSATTSITAEELHIGDTLYGEPITEIQTLSDPWIRFTTTAAFGQRIQDIESWQTVVA